MDVDAFERAYRDMLCNCISHGHVGFHFEHFGVTGRGPWAPSQSSIDRSQLLDVAIASVPVVDSSDGHGIYRSLTSSAWDQGASFRLSATQLSYPSRGAVEFYQDTEYRGGKYTVASVHGLRAPTPQVITFERGGSPHYDGTTRSVFETISSIRIPWGFTVECAGAAGNSIAFRPPTHLTPPPTQNSIPNLVDLGAVQPLLVTGSIYTRNTENWNDRITRATLIDHHSTGSLSYRELIATGGGGTSTVVARVNFLPDNRLPLAHARDGIWLDIDLAASRLQPALVFTHDGPPSRTGYSTNNEVRKGTYDTVLNGMWALLGMNSPHPFQLANDFRPILDDRGAPVSSVYRDFHNQHAFLVCTRSFSNTVSLWTYLFRKSIYQYYSQLSCDVLVRDRISAEAAFVDGKPSERLYHYCVADQNTNMFSPMDDICRRPDHAAELMRLTTAWGPDSYENKVRQSCTNPVTVDKCLVDVDSVARQVCGCFLPASIVEVYRSSLMQVPTSNLECWYPPCQVGNMIRPFPGTDCPGGNTYVNCSQSIQLQAGGGIDVSGALSSACSQLIDMGDGGVAAPGSNQTTPETSVTGINDTVTGTTTGTTTTGTTTPPDGGGVNWGTEEMTVLYIIIAAAVVIGAGSFAFVMLSKRPIDNA